MSSNNPLASWEKMFRNFKNQRRNYYINIQLSHFNRALNKQRLQTNAKYKEAYNRIKALIGPNFNERTARGIIASKHMYAKVIQNYFREFLLKKPPRGYVIVHANRTKSFVRVPHRSNAARRNAALKKAEILERKAYENRIAAGNYYR